MRVSSLMSEYFRQPGDFLNESPGKMLPITAKQEVWTHTENPEALRRMFQFSSIQSLLNFLEDVIQMQDEIGHHGKLLIEKNIVLAHISTESLQRVTELDVEWAAKVDEIYDDVTSLNK